MIIGAVNARSEATIRLPVRAADGREQEIETLLDTGFNGSLTLPPCSHRDSWTLLAHPWLSYSCQWH